MSLTTIAGIIVDPTWILAVLGILTLGGGLWKIAMSMGKMTEVIKQILRNQNDMKSDIELIRNDCNDHEGRIIAVETTLKVEART